MLRSLKAGIWCNGACVGAMGTVDPVAVFEHPPFHAFALKSPYVIPPSPPPQSILFSLGQLAKQKSSPALAGCGCALCGRPGFEMCFRLAF